MARKAMVTRTILATLCTYVSMNLETLTTEEKTVVLSGSYEDKPVKEALKKVRSVIDETKELAVKVINLESHNTLYGMYEEDFIKNAMELNEKRQPIEFTEDPEKE